MRERHFGGGHRPTVKISQPETTSLSGKGSPSFQLYGWFGKKKHNPGGATVKWASVASDRCPRDFMSQIQEREEGLTVSFQK